MKNIIHLVSFAALLLPALAFADSVEVQFNAALTNDTEWVYSDKILSSDDGQEHVYFKSLNSYISSPEYSFNITSVVLRLSCSSITPSRYLYVKADGLDRQQAMDVAKKDKVEEQSFHFSAADSVRSFSLALEGNGNTGNWHVFSAEIYGAPIVEAPTSLHASNASGTRFTLRWDNCGAVASNAITIARIIDTPMSMSVLDDYAFEVFTNNGGNAQNILDDNHQMLNYAAFSGDCIYRAGNSTGVVQISSRENRGVLAYDTQKLFSSEDAAEGLSLLISAKKHPTDDSGTWGLGVAITDGNASTNDVCTLDIDFDFPSHPAVVSLPTMHRGESILMFPSDSTKSNRRILIDSMSFVRDYIPAKSDTNIVARVQTTGSTKTIRGLEPKTKYLVHITAIDGEGNESPPSEAIVVRTTDRELPFIIKIQ